MITETVLEMHYHKPLMDAFRDTLGVGDEGNLNFYKYSAQKECFVGFDQAYAKSNLSEAEFFNQLQSAASSSNYELTDLFIGYFLQFKVVKRMRRRSRYTPTSIKNSPHYRISLDTTKNAQTGLSQHELLYNLNKNAGAMVYYACPMLFDRSSLYDIEVDLDSLRLADLDTCPSSHADNDNHFIFFDDIVGQPVWCSEPVDGRALSPQQFINETIDARFPQGAAESARELLEILTNLETVGVQEDSPALWGRARRSILPLVSEMLTVIRVSQKLVE